MPFWVVSVVGYGTGVLDGVGDCRRGRGSFMGEFGASSHCNQWGLCCVVVRKCANLSSCRLGW